MALKTTSLLLAVFCSIQLFAQVVPSTKKQPKVFNEHGHERVDDYYWLSNPGDSNVIKHLTEENAYVDAYLKKTEGLQKTIFDELVGRIEQRFVSLPNQDNGYWYYIGYDKDAQYPKYFRKKGTLAAKEELMLDVPQMAKAYQIFLVRGWKVSDNNRYLAYAIDTNGSRRSQLKIRDLNTGKDLPDVMNNTSGQAVWSADGKQMLYVTNDHTVRSYKVMLHTIGSSTSADKEIYTEKDSTFSVYIQKSKTGRYVFIHRGHGNSSEVAYLDAANLSGSPVLIAARQPNILYFPEHYEGSVFHIRTNKDATNFRLVSAPVSNPGIDNWKDVIAHDPEAMLEGTEILKNYIVGQWKKKGLTQILYLDRKTNNWKAVPFDQDAYIADMSMATDRYDSDSIRFYYSSLVTPGTDYAYNLKTGSRKQLKQQQVAGFNASLYQTKRIWIKATDGTQVPVVLAYKKSLFKQDGSNPLYLYAYGSYGANSDPFFNSSAVSLMDRGVVYAIANIRGGQEMGRAWYENAKVLTKKNTFTDFVDAAQSLVDQKYTSKDRLFANGGSAGGMLMGAVTNLRPDLFRGIIAEVPWMDVVTDMLNPDLPLTTLEYTEWGDPTKKEEYEYMLSWSPQDNIKKASYPAILATGGLHDTQVPYFSPAKWVAKVRENNLGSYPVLFKVNMGAGHGGESGRFARQKLTALKFAFMLDQLGWDESTKTFRTKGF